MSLYSMKFAIIIAVLVLLSEAGPAQPSLTSVPLWYTPCTSREGLLQTQRFVKKLEEITAYPMTYPQVNCPQKKGLTKQ
jgi:hypothetical protein